MKDGIIEIGPDDIDQLRLFLNDAGNALSKFRYFRARPLSIIGNHIVTILYYQQNKPVGYGHLDLENDKVWFGVAVHDSMLGCGIGTSLANYLKKKANELNLEKIYLSVDKDNEPAIRLYQKLAFRQIDQNDAVLFYELRL